jgi:hypothetical protein
MKFIFLVLFSLSSIYIASASVQSNTTEQAEYSFVKYEKNCECEVTDFTDDLKSYVSFSFAAKKNITVAKSIDLSTYNNLLHLKDLSPLYLK